ncbi:eukaryotic translation initiation factor 3a [Dorcoceras hygrometricum]|uniref:Eukaryotic translation initiation factor 3a n=1 Tax=Dorcoceras hygrometricum TaxID=472368 RepID=A0A2Z6ZWX8_9LAMI|nr:eukaryotic translation initiation factor 3a [Dorcoceras hygrometricum]
MTFRVVRTNQYNQDLGLIHSTNGNHLESLKEGSSIDHQVTIYLHAQNITMFPTNETCGIRARFPGSDQYDYAIIVSNFRIFRIEIKTLILATGRRIRRLLPVRHIVRARLDAHVACAGRRLAQAVALIVAQGGREPTIGPRPCEVDARRRCLKRAVARGAAIFVVVAPPAGRRSGDVMTAGLNSSRVWFGPVPGSP